MEVWVLLLTFLIMYCWVVHAWDHPSFSCYCWGDVIFWPLLLGGALALLLDYMLEVSLLWVLGVFDTCYLTPLIEKNLVFLIIYARAVVAHV